MDLPRASQANTTSAVILSLNSSEASEKLVAIFATVPIVSAFHARYSMLDVFDHLEDRVKDVRFAKNRIQAGYLLVDYATKQMVARGMLALVKAIKDALFDDAELNRRVSMALVEQLSEPHADLVRERLWLELLRIARVENIVH